METAESRCLVRTGVEETGDLIPESVLPTRWLVVEHGCLRYRARACWSLMRDPHSGDNQGGTADVYSSLRSSDLRDFHFILRSWTL